MITQIMKTAEVEQRKTQVVQFNQVSKGCAGFISLDLSSFPSPKTYKQIKKPLVKL